MRLYGRRASQFPNYSALTPLASPAPKKEGGLLSSIASAVTSSSSSPASSSSLSVPKVPAVPLTPDAFSTYGSVIQSYPDHRSARKDVVIKPVNFGTAFKFNHLSPVTWVQPKDHPEVKGEVNFCVFRCEQQNGVKGANGKESWEVKVLERHEFSSQAFVPMGGGGGRYLVLVCLPGAGELIRSDSTGRRSADPSFRLSPSRRRPARPHHPPRLPRYQRARNFLPPQHLAPPHHRPRCCTFCSRLSSHRRKLTFRTLRRPTLPAWCTRRASLVLIARSRSLVRL